MHKKIELKVTGMHCKSCETLISDELKDIGAKNIKISFKTNEATFDIDSVVSEDKILTAVKNAGYDSIVLNPSEIVKTSNYLRLMLCAHLQQKRHLKQINNL